jgi:hypothetical protein
MLFPRRAIDEIDLSYRARRADAVATAVASCFAGREPADIPAWWHPLGFFRIELPALDDGHRYVLHSWPRGERLGEPSPWQVHCHAWVVESLVLSGRIRDVQYRQVDSAGTVSGTLYVASNVGEASRLDRTSTAVGLDVEREVSTEPGGFYSIEMQTFHRSVVRLDERCVTVARLGPRTGEKAYVLGDNDGPAARIVETARVGADTLAALLRDIRRPAALA